VFNLIKRIIARAVWTYEPIVFAFLPCSFPLVPFPSALTRVNARGLFSRSSRKDMRVSKHRPTSIRSGDKAEDRDGGKPTVWGERAKEGDKEKIRRAPNIDGVRRRASTLNALSYVRALCERCLVVLPRRLRARTARSSLSSLLHLTRWQPTRPEENSLRWSTTSKATKARDIKIFAVDSSVEYSIVLWNLVRSNLLSDTSSKLLFFIFIIWKLTGNNSHVIKSSKFQKIIINYMIYKYLYFLIFYKHYRHQL